MFCTECHYPTCFINFNINTHAFITDGRISVNAGICLAKIDNSAGSTGSDCGRLVLDQTYKLTDSSCVGNNLTIGKISDLMVAHRDIAGHGTASPNGIIYCPTCN